MKVKTSVTLSEDCLRELEQLAGKKANRSALIEEAVMEYLERRRKLARGRNDRQLIERHSEALARDVHETLEFQTPE